MEWNKPFIVTNNSNGKIIHKTFVIKHGETLLVDPRKQHPSVIDVIKGFYELGQVEVTNDIPKEFLQAEKEETLPVEQVRDNKSTVFNPEAKFKKTSIVVESLNTNSKSVEVNTNINSDGKSVEVGFTELDRAEAEDFLAQHWKRIEKQLEEINSVRKLQFYLEVAKELNVAEKKVELIEDRLKALK